MLGRFASHLNENCTYGHKCEHNPRVVMYQNGGVPLLHNAKFFIAVAIDVSLQLAL